LQSLADASDCRKSAPLLLKAVKLAPGADEQLVVGGDDRRTQLPVSLIAHVGLMQQRELLPARPDHVDLTFMIHEVDASISPQRRCLEFGARSQFAGPDYPARRRLDS